MSNSSPKLSAIVSYYNGSRFLKRFLENYREQQGVEDTELVFVPCLLSKEDEAAINKFKEENPNLSIFIIPQDKLVKQSVCWNIGIKNSKSKWITIWNIDDLRTKYSLKTIIDKTKKLPGVGCISGNFVITKLFNDFSGKLIDHTTVPEAEFTRSMVLGPFFAFDKSLCDSIGYFDEQFKVCADYDFAIRLGLNTKVFVTKTILGYFLDEMRGLSTNGDGTQPIERTAIEMRYGLADKIESQFVASAKSYQKDSVLQFGEFRNLNPELGKVC